MGWPSLTISDLEKGDQQNIEIPPPKEKLEKKEIEPVP